MFSVAPNIVLAPNMTQNAERKHRTQNTNTAYFKSCQAWLKAIESFSVFPTYILFFGVMIIIIMIIMPGWWSVGWEFKTSQNCFWF